MKAIAAEAGLDPVLVERAARLIPLDSRVSLPERVLGGPVKYRLDAHFSANLTDHRTAHLLSAVRASAEQQGEGQADSSGMSWRSVGEGSQILVTAHAEGEGTRVRVVADRRGAFAITGTFTLLGALAVAIAVVVAGEIGALESGGGGVVTHRRRDRRDPCSWTSSVGLDRPQDSGEGGRPDGHGRSVAGGGCQRGGFAGFRARDASTSPMTSWRS